MGVRRMALKNGPEAFREHLTQYQHSQDPWRGTYFVPPFEAGHFWGKPGPVTHMGHLPDEYRSNCGHADYAVYSYYTPIAWRNQATGMWHVPEVSYSMSTTRHQNLIRAAVEGLNDALRKERRNRHAAEQE